MSRPFTIKALTRSATSCKSSIVAVPNRVFDNEPTNDNTARLLRRLLVEGGGRAGSACFALVYSGLQFFNQ